MDFENQTTPEELKIILEKVRNFTFNPKFYSLRTLSLSKI